MAYRRISVDIMTWMLVTLTAAELREYCLRERFEAACGDNEVVVMTSAHYGRLRLGKCVKKNFGYLGCGFNVISQADRLCSGHQRCSVDVFKTFENLKPCSELESFLEADYKCVSVINIAPHHCLATGSEPITSDLGFISSHSTERVIQPGHRSCTLTLTAKPGQRWNISLVDYSVAAHSAHVTTTGSRDHPDDIDSGRVTICQRYAVIRDEKLSAASVICGGGGEREKVAHLSSGHVILVEVFGRAKNSSSTSAQFLLRVEAIGCPDLEPTNYVVVWRDTDHVQVKCNSTNTGQLFDLTCVNKKWTGDVIKCEEEKNRTFWQMIQLDWSSRPAYGILLMTLLGIILGILIGCTMLAISVLCHRRKMRRENANRFSGEIQKTLLMRRKSVEFIGQQTTASAASRDRNLHSAAAAGQADDRRVVCYATQTAHHAAVAAAAACRAAIWRQTTTSTLGGARCADECAVAFGPHKCSLRTTEADNSGQRRQSTDFGSAAAVDNIVVDEGCRYHACLQKTNASAEAEMGRGTSSSFTAAGDVSAGAQPMYSESSGYGNSMASLSTMEHIYEIPQ